MYYLTLKSSLTTKPKLVSKLLQFRKWVCSSVYVIVKNEGGGKLIIYLWFDFLWDFNIMFILPQVFIAPTLGIRLTG